MSWNYDSESHTWYASDYDDLDLTAVNNLIVTGQPWEPSNPNYSIAIEAYHLTYSSPPVKVQMPQIQVMEFGYGAGVSVNDFGAGGLLGETTSLSDGEYSKDDLITAGLATNSDFVVKSTLYTPGLNIADGNLLEAYVHGTVNFAIGANSRFVVVNGEIVEIRAEIRAFDDNFNFVSSNIPNWLNQGPVQYILGPGNVVPAGGIVLLEFRGEGRIEVVSVEQCFLEGTSISMADGSTRSIELVKPDDAVVCYDKNGELQKALVGRVFASKIKQILDFWGTGVTPGHAYFCADGKARGQHIILLDILRQDAAVQKVDGSLMRASTGADVEGPLDGFVQAVTGEVGPDGQLQILNSKSIRHGTRVILDDGRDICIADVIAAGGGTLREDGLIATEDCPEGMPFHWTFSETLPNPEDYILKRSGTTLEDIYKAAEWEHHKPQMPAPMMYEGVPVEPAAPRQREDMPRNEPLYMDELLRKAERSVN